MGWGPTEACKQAFIHDFVEHGGKLLIFKQPSNEFRRIHAATFNRGSSRFLFAVRRCSCKSAGRYRGRLGVEGTLYHLLCKLLSGCRGLCAASPCTTKTL
jgi:hypothetical protein